MRLDGRDVLPELLAEHGDAIADEIELPAACSTTSGRSRPITCTTSTRTTACSREQQVGVPRAQTVAEIERELLQMYRDPTLTEKPALLEQRGGAFYSEAAVGLVRSLASGDGAVHVVDTRNGGTLAGLADDDVVEVPARVDGRRPGAARAGAARAGAPRPRAARRGVRAADRSAQRSRGTRSRRGRRCSRIR